MAGFNLSSFDGLFFGDLEADKSQVDKSYVRDLLQEKLLLLRQQILNIEENKNEDNLSLESCLSMKKDQIYQIEKLLSHMENKKEAEDEKNDV